MARSTEASQAIRRILGTFACLVAGLAAYSPQVSAANVNTTCGAATSRGANGPADYATYCWVNFAGYAQADASDANGQLYTVALPDGGSMSFRLRVTTSAARAAGVPSWSGAPFGQTAFLGVPGSPVVYQAVDGSTMNVTLSGITVTAGAGGQVPYAFVAADAESSNNGETLGFTTNGDPWTLLASMQNGGSPLFPSLSGVGTQNVSMTGVAGSVGAYAFASSGSPTTISASMVGSGLQGISFGVKYLAADLRIDKTHSGGFQAGGTGSYALSVTNNGPDPYTSANTFTVTDTLPTGLSFVSASASGWSCSAAGQVVTCSTNSNLASGASLASITINVGVAPDAPASVTNTAAVSVLNGYDYDSSNNTASDATPIAHADLSGSSKAVEDVDGGYARPGDTLRYTITLLETAGIAASNLRVTDDIAANLGNLVIVSHPTGAVNASTTSGGANNTGYLDITGIDLPANGSAAIVFEVDISGSAASGATVANTAAIRNSANVVLKNAAAPAVTVQTSAPATSGNKYLYLNTNLSLSRAQPGIGGNLTWGNATRCFAQPPLAAPLTLSSSTAVVSLRLRRADTSNPGNRRVRARIFKNGTSTPLTGNSNSTNVDTSVYDNFANVSWTFDGGNALNDTTFGAGEFLVVCVEAVDNKQITVSQNDGGVFSFLRVAAQTVINVDSVSVYAGPYASSVQSPPYVQGETVHVRAVVSDPFGNADITGASVKLTDGTGAIVMAPAAMTAIPAATTASTKTFERSFTIPPNPRTGGWTAEVTATEGQETSPVVSHTSLGGFAVAGKVTLGKAWANAVSADAVALTIVGAGSTTAGSSVASGTTTAATAKAVATSAITVDEAFTNGDAGGYVATMSCTRDRDGMALVLGGSGLSRSFTMPADSAVTCTWTNTRIVPLTLVKLNSVVSDPVNGTTRPKAIPGAIVEYQIVVLNPGTFAADADSVVVTDPMPVQLALAVADIGTPGSGPVSFTDGSPPSGLGFAFTSLGSTADDVAFSSDGGATWTYVPVASGDGTDALVNALRINPTGVFNAGNATFTLKFRARVK